jgi:5-methylcytosine-specific restriction endonuclease McrA
VLGPLEIEHLDPLSAGGTNAEENLWLSCRMCNCFKAGQTDGVDPTSQERVPLFDPRRLRWSDHFSWSPDGTHIVGSTSTGRATVLALQLNHAIAVTVRRIWASAGWHPPPKET